MSSAPAVLVAVTLCSAFWSAAFSIPHPSSPPPARCRLATAASSLGELLGLGAVDEDELYGALDWLLERQPAIEATLAKRHLTHGTLLVRRTTCRRATWKVAAAPSPSGAIAVMAKKGTLQIIYGLLCAPDGCPVASEVFDGNTADPMTLAAQIGKLKQRFCLDHVVLVGDRGMITQPRITQARITQDIRAAGLDWITCRAHRRSRPLGSTAAPCSSAVRSA